MSARRGERYTDGEIATIRRLAGERRTDEEIGLLLGRARVSITTVRKSHRIAAGGGTHVWAEPVETELVDRIRKLAGDGWSDERIGRETGRSRLKVMRLRKRLGIEPGNPQMGQKVHLAVPQIAAEARREAHIQMLRERKAARRAAEMNSTDA